MKFGHLEGEQPYLGDLLTKVINHTKWDDPRSTPIKKGMMDGEVWFYDDFN